MQRVEGGALGLGDRGRHGQARADAAAAAVVQQPRTGGDDGLKHLGRVGGDLHAAGRGRHDASAETDQRGAEAVGVDLGGEGDGAVLVHGEPVGGAALGSGPRTGAGVDADEAEGLQLGGDGAGGGAGDTELGGEHGPRGRAARVHQFQGGAEGAAAPVQPCPGRRRLAVHAGESPMIRRAGRPAALFRRCLDGYCGQRWRGTGPTTAG